VTTHTRGRFWQRLSALFLILTILLAFTLRLYHLEQFSFWTDEGLTPERSGYALTEILRNSIYIQGVETKDTHPPLYYLLIHFTRQMFGESDFAFRYPPVLFGVLLVPLMFRFGRALSRGAGERRWSESTPRQRWSGGAGEQRRFSFQPSAFNLQPLTPLGLLAAFLAAVNPLQIYYSQEARMYSLLVLLGAGMSYVLWRALARPEPSQRQVLRSLGLYILLAALAFYTHYTCSGGRDCGDGSLALAWRPSFWSSR
jgi:uncharacterized membrane protein